MWPLMWQPVLNMMDRKLELVRSLALLTSQHFANRNDAQIPLVYIWRGLSQFDIFPCYVRGVTEEMYMTKRNLNEEGGSSCWQRHTAVQLINAALCKVYLRKQRQIETMLEQQLLEIHQTPVEDFNTFQNMDLIHTVQQSLLLQRFDASHWLPAPAVLLFSASQTVIYACNTVQM